MAKKVKGFEDFNIEGEKEKLQKIKRSFKPNSDQQQFTTNTRNEFDETTRKITAVTKDEVDDKLKSLEETNEGIFSDEGQAGMNGERYSEVTPEEKAICLKVYRQYRSECLDSDGDYSMMFEDWLKRK
jgi:hypothetical protein